VSDEDLLRRAIDLAADNVRDRVGGPFGALVVRAGEVLATGTNRVTADLDPTAHAEIVAVRAACRAAGSHELRGCVLYSSCEPCPMCLAAVLWSRLDRIVYAGDRDDAAAAGFDDRRFYRELSRPGLPMRRLLAEEGRAPFALWRAAPDRQPY
jgi:guanine deaminase